MPATPRSSGEDAYKSRILCRECLLDLFRQANVLVSHAPVTMGRANEVDPGIVDVHIGMMVGGFGHIGDPSDEPNAVHKLFETKQFAEGVIPVFPSGQRFQFLTDLCLA